MANITMTNSNFTGGDRVRQNIIASLSSKSTVEYLTYSLLALCFLLFLTRTISSRNDKSTATGENGEKPVPAVPYWIPLVGHIPNMAADADGFVKNLRHRYNQGIFALNFGGTTHNIVYSPGLATSLLNQKLSVADNDGPVWTILQRVFGFPLDERESYDRSSPDLLGCYKYLLTDPSLGKMVETTAKKIRENIVSLVTFSKSPVDQTLWERTSKVKLSMNSAGKEVVEASLLPVIRDFCAHSANTSLMGSNFLANFPDFFEDLWKLDRGFLLVAAGLPRWLPIPMLTRAYIAQKRILERMELFEQAMEKEVTGQDPGPDWRDLDDVGNMVKNRVPVYRKYGFSMRARAALEHSLNWAANANSNVLVFWMINRIYADAQLLAMIRTEIAPYARAVQPKQEFVIPEAPRLDTLDVDGLCASCSLLKSCYYECLRLDTASWSLKVVKQDFVLQSREKEAQKWVLKKGEYAHAAHDMHNTDPDYFEHPLVWKADRHVKYEGVEKFATAEMGSIRPYGGGSSMCKGRSFAFRECMAFAAAIIALWDIEPAGGGEWKMPRHRKATGVYGTGDDTRVWIKRRTLPLET